MEYTIEIKEAITKEADALKLELTQEEISNLDIETFDPYEPHGCTYGQTTGGCHSERAIELLTKCAVPYSINIDKYVPVPEDSHFGDRKLFVAGHDDVYSILEFATFNDDNFRHHLIPYLKSEITILDI